MKNKMVTAAQAVAGIKDGDVVMVGGFLGTGTPEILMDALVAQGTKHLTIIANDGGLPAENPDTNGRLKGVAKLLANGQVDHVIMSHVGMNPLIGQGMMEGTLKVTLSPQGTLAERIRAAGAGLGGVLTPTGVGTLIESGEAIPVGDKMISISEKKERVTIDGKDYLFEKPLHADWALLRADICDKYGNFSSFKATKNFNHVMAMAAENVVVASEKVYEIGEKDPDDYTVAGVYVTYIVEGEPKWEI